MTDTPIALAGLDIDDDELMRLVRERAKEIVEGENSGSARLILWGELMKPEVVPDDQFLEAFLIKPKDADKRATVPFRFNWIQQQIYNEIQRQLKDRGYVRMIILKARQMGASTIVDGLLYGLAVRNAGRDCLVIADKDDNSKILYETKIRHLHNQIPKEVRPPSASETKRELVYAHEADGIGVPSAIRVITAGGREGSRSQTAQYLHLSELAFWENPERVLLATLQSVPDDVGWVVIESTANGRGNNFHKRWRDARDGKSEYVPMFFSWMNNPEYHRKFYTDIERVEFLMGLTKKEKRIKKEMKLSLEQINWRRHTIINKCDGDEQFFEQEYPATEHEAFIASGSCRFRQESLDLLKAKAPKVRDVGYLVEESRTRYWVPDSDGCVTLYRKPKKGRHYVIGADVGEGLYDGDFSTFPVYDRHRMLLMAEVHGRYDMDDFAEILATVGRWYNYALIAPEAPGPGYAVIEALLRMGYRNLYTRRQVDQKKKKTKTQWGWHTSPMTRLLIISNLASFVHEGAAEFSLPQIKEMEGFVRGKNKKYEAEAGGYDDRVLAVAITLYVMVSELAPRPTSMLKDEIRPGRDYEGAVVRGLHKKLKRRRRSAGLGLRVR